MAERQPIPIRFKLARRFYEPIVLDVALKSIGGDGPMSLQREPNNLDDSTDNADDAFQSFVNRLAHVCDSRKHGDTVTAIAVLEEADCVHYIVGSNRRNVSELGEVQAFILRLLKLVIPQDHSSSTAQEAKRKLLWHVLQFNQQRIDFYIRQMSKNLDLCIEDHKRRYPSNLQGVPAGSEQVLRHDLVSLQHLAKSQIDKPPDDSESSFFGGCEALMVWIQKRVQHTQFMDSISQQSQDGLMTIRRPWIEFKHFFGRLRSYHLAIDTIIRTSRQFSSLFNDVRVTVIPSAKAMPSVLSKAKTTAGDIIGRMLPKDEVSQWRAKVAGLQMFGLDDSIANQIKSEAHTHTVHAEILVLDYVLRYMRNEEATRFWNTWRYIGSSKPTCRLCNYFFMVHSSRIKARNSHGNLYPSWRVPDVFTEEGAKERDGLLDKMIQMIRQDVLRVIETRQRPGRNHDSNSYSQIRSLTRIGQTDTPSVNDLESQFSSMDLGSQHGGTAL